MLIDLETIVIYAFLPSVITMGSFIVRSFVKRLDELEDKMQRSTTEPQVRQLINDRYDPLAQDIREIKEKLDKLFDMQLQQLRDMKKDE